MNKFAGVIKAIIIVIIMICIASYVLTHYDTKEYGIEQIDEYVERMCEIADVPGMSIVVRKDNHDSYINVGYADRKAKIEATEDTQYELGSTTKAFTALGILLLEQDGMLDRSDSVSKYLPWFEPTYHNEKVDVTIEQLLCHTSGIPVWTVSKLPIGTISETGLLEQTVRTIQSVELEHLPGKVYCYATINYDVLALVMEKVTGMKYEKYIEQNVLKPLGMKDSYFRVDNSKTGQLSQGYRYLLMGLHEYDAPAFYGNTAAGYLMSTTKDLTLWMKAQMGLLEMDMTDSLEKLSTAIKESHSYPIENGQNYWAGWNLHDSYFAHCGNNPNFSSQVIINRDGTKAVFALSNINSAATTATADGIFRMLCGQKVQIGFFTDYNSFTDFVCTILCLIEILLGICIWERRNGIIRHAVVKAVVFIIISNVVVAFPYLLHYNYLTLTVWNSPSLVIAILGAATCGFGYAGICVKNRAK